MGSWYMKLSNYMGGRCLWKLNSMGGWVKNKVPSSPPGIFFWNSPEHNLEFLSLKRGYTGSSGSTHVKMPHCWKSHHATAQIFTILNCEDIFTIIMSR